MKRALNTWIKKKREKIFKRISLLYETETDSTCMTNRMKQ